MSSGPREAVLAELARGGFTLVLGGGGAPGLAYLAGALTALEDAGVDPAQAEVVIGTSAGALVGALLRSGCPPRNLLRTAVGSAVLAGEPLFEPGWRSVPELWARCIGATWVVGQSILRVPMPAPPHSFSRLFPGSLAAIKDSDGLYALPTDGSIGVFGRWPEKPLWAVAVDLISGDRVTLGASPQYRDLSFLQAVRASTAVPGLLPPIRWHNKVLVDGGVHSTTNLDLAADSLTPSVICVAPMAFDPTSLPGRARRMLHSRVQAQLD